MKKFVENIKTYIQYRRNRRYVKMEMMKYKAEFFKFLTEVIEGNVETPSLSGDKLKALKENWNNLVTKVQEVQKERG